MLCQKAKEKRSDVYVTERNSRSDPCIQTLTHGREVVDKYNLDQQVRLGSVKYAVH